MRPHLHGCTSSRAVIAARLLVLLLMFACCAEVRAHSSNLNPSMKVSGLRVSLHPTSTSIQVTWNMQDNNKKVHEYEVTLLEGDFVHEIIYVKGIKTKFFDLSPCVTYHVKLQGFDNAGRNVGSPVTEQATTDDAAPPPVRSLTAEHITSGSLTVNWKPPETACSITQYDITYDGEAMWGPRSKHTGNPTTVHDATSFVMNDLLPYADYTITVTASTKTGRGQKAEMKQRTKQDVPSEPTQLNALQVMSTSITMVWKEPKEQRGVVDKYKVQWNSKHFPPSEETTSHPVHIIAHLSPCTKYTVMVAGITEGGQGKFNTTQVTTEPAAPSEPSITTCESEGGEMVMEWEKPESTCDITGFKVFNPNNPMDFEDISTSEMLHTSNPDHSCVAAMTSDKVIGPETCCKPQMKTTTTTTPKTHSPETEATKTGGAPSERNGAKQTSSNFTVLLSLLYVATAWLKAILLMGHGLAVM